MPADPTRASGRSDAPGDPVPSPVSPTEPASSSVRRSTTPPTAPTSAAPPAAPDPGPSSVTGGAMPAPEGVRRANLARVLRLVHEGGATPRSAITRATGLNRSTVGGLVGELERLGLVSEAGPAPAGGPAGRAVGRPSPTVSASADVVAVALNPEVDELRAAAVGLDGTEHLRLRRPLDRVPTPDQAVSGLAELVAELRGRLPGAARLVGIGLAVPGIVRTGDGLVRLAPHLGWHDEPLAARLATATGLPVRAANDAALGVRAEQLHGSARGRRHVVYVNGGASGIGGGLVVDGAPLGGRDGYAGEIGHAFVDGRDLPCHCGSRGCLETVVSQERLLRAAGLGPADADDLPEALAAPAPDLADEVDRQLGFLARALRGVLLTTDPELVVLGGFLGVLHDAAGERLAELVTGQTLAVVAEGTTLTRAALGSSILLRGAAELAFDALLADPAGVTPSLVPAR